MSGTGVIEVAAKTARSRITKLLPQSLARALHKGRERLRLARVPNPGAIDTSRLASSITATTLANLFSDATLADEWSSVERELAALGITPHAGGINHGDRRALYYLVRRLAPRSVLEVGTHIGASTVHVAAALRSSMSAAPARLVTVDVADVNEAATRPWVKFGARMSPSELVARVGMAHAVEFVARDSVSYLTNGDETFDFIFLDGDHAAKTVYQEVPAALRRLQPNGLILLHDYFPRMEPLWRDGKVLPGSWLAIQRLRDEGAQLDVIPLGELPWQTKAGSRRTSLALLVRS